MNLNGLTALTTEDELKETLVIGQNPRLILKRTFNQSDFKGGYIKYWRVETAGHRFFGSDLSLQGLKDWKLI